MLTLKFLYVTHTYLSHKIVKGFSKSYNILMRQSRGDSHMSVILNTEGLFSRESNAVAMKTLRYGFRKVYYGGTSKVLESQKGSAVSRAVLSL